MSGNCERARAWASRELDGELSELESAMLHHHVGRCEPCAVFVEGTSRATQMLRQAPLEQIASRIVVMRHRRRPSVLRAASTLAAACVVLAMVGVTVSRELRYQSSPDQRSPIEQRLFTEQPKLGSDATARADDPGIRVLAGRLPVGQRNARDDF
jgi:predicted anti-sigma-YlaC factor YlaD